MIDAAAEAVVTGAAGNVVAYMLSGRLDALRAWSGRVFRPEQRAEVLQALETDAEALESKLASEHDVATRWAGLLRSYLELHPEVQQEVGSLASPQNGTKTTIIGSQNNYGSGMVIGGDNYGSISLGPGPGSS